MENNPQKTPSLFLSLTPVATLTGLLAVTIRLFGSDALSGASQLVLLTASAVCCLLAMTCCGVRWKNIETAIVHNITSVSSALLILLLVGALSGSWMVSGVIPTLIYYGVQIIHPDFFLASTCVICAFVSLMTGSSWTTVATLGIALAGIGKVQGFSEGWIAGAIISGAYFGDKISPLSDTTILASSVTGTPLFRHIRYMLITTIPSLTLAILIYLVAGFSSTSAPSADIDQFTSALAQAYHISPWLLLVPLLTGVLIGRKAPPVITLFVSMMAGGVAALVFQPDILRQIAGTETSGAASIYKGLLQSFYGQTQMHTGNGTLDGLTVTRGMAGMLNTIWLIICAMCFGGTMTASGMLTVITSVFLRCMKRRTSMVASTVFSGVFLNVCTADQYLSIILSGNMFKDVFRKKGYESCLLSRTIEDGTTVTSPLIPWNTCGMTQSTVLHIDTLTYLPYCFFNLLSPLMTILVAMTGYRIKRHELVVSEIATGNSVI
ncbi:MAG: sodium:proton antiporter [Tannerella sp.]|jgi:NhaC family Na+:H+ antiporter|nr:sodium:proton antiporter [Tannerella sp.]